MILKSFLGTLTSITLIVIALAINGFCNLTV